MECFVLGEHVHESGEAVGVQGLVGRGQKKGDEVFFQGFPAAHPLKIVAAAVVIGPVNF